MLRKFADKRDMKMEKDKAIRLLEEAGSRVNDVLYRDLPKRYLARAQTIHDKLVDLREDILAEKVN